MTTIFLDMFRFADELGPAKIIHVHKPAIGLRAVLVVDKVAAGLSRGSGEAHWGQGMLVPELGARTSTDMAFVPAAEAGGGNYSPRAGSGQGRRFDRRL